MDKFKGKVICCDMDGTLIDDNFEIPKANLSAIEYFRSEGGIFTVATGRTPGGIVHYMNELRFDCPIVCQNGGAIYDYYKEEYLWHVDLDRDAEKVIDYVKEYFPLTGVEIMSTTGAYCVAENASTRKHETDEHFKFLTADINGVSGGWLKIVFANVPDVTDKIQHLLEESEFYEKYQMVRSYSTYYEFVHKKTNKAYALGALSEIINIDISNFIVIGDNENDCAMLSMPTKSFTPSTGVKLAKECADIVLKSSHNDGVLKEVVEILDNEN